MGFRLKQPGFGMAIVLTLLAVALQVALSMPLGLVDVVYQHGLRREPPRLGQHPLMVGFLNLLAFSGAIAFGLLLNRLPLRRAFPFGGTTALRLVAVSIFILGADIVLSEVDNVFRWMFPPPRFVVELFERMFAEGQLLSRIFLLVLVAPITEELLFRGIILRGLLSRTHWLMAVTFSAFLFAGAHLNPWQFNSALLLGVAFGWFYARTGSVAICIIAHALSNGLLVLVGALPIKIPGLTAGEDFGVVEFQPWWLNLAGLLLLVAGLALFRSVSSFPAEESPEEPPIIASPPPPIL